MKHPFYSLATWILAWTLMLAGCLPAAQPPASTSLVVEQWTPVPTTLLLIPTLPPAANSPTILPTVTATLRPALILSPTASASPTSHLTRVPFSSLIAFTSIEGGKPAVYTIRPDGTELKRLVIEPEVSFAPQWSPDGQRIAFLSGAAGEFGESWSLYILDFDSGDLQKVDVPDVLNFAWSPSGEFIALSAGLLVEPPNSGDYNIYVVKVGDLSYELIKWSPDFRPTAIKWSPKGDQIALDMQYRGITSLGFLELLGKSIPPQEKMFKFPKEKIIGLYGFSWSPDGKQYVFSAFNHLDLDDLAGGSRLVTNDVNDQPQKVLYSGEISPHHITWSPNGSWLAFDDGVSIYLFDLETLQMKPLETTAYSDFMPGWSVDNRYLVFISANNPGDLSTRGLNIYDLDTGAIHTIFRGNIHDSTPVWRP